MNSDSYIRYGPYISYGHNAATEMRISWRTNQYTLKKVLWYGSTEICEHEILEEYSEPQTHHCVVLHDLTPNTKYYYRIKVGANDKDTNVFHFRTAPLIAENPAEGFDFTVLGDIHANGLDRIQIDELFPAIRRNVKANQFYLAVGDSVDDGHREVDWDFFFENFNSWLSHTPLMNTTGNHDCSTPAKYARFLSIWDHPYVNSKLGGFYSFQYGDVLFIMADSDNGEIGRASCRERV